MAYPLDVVIMAAGKGTRMKSALPKVLHRLGGRALLAHVVDCAAQLSARRVVVVTGHGAEQVESECQILSSESKSRLNLSLDFSGFELQFARQEPQLGTGHAVQQAAPWLQSGGITLVLNGDVPLMQAETLRALIDECDGTRLALLTVTLAEPMGYGRIVRGSGAASGEVRAIVEHKDASAEQRKITEIYSGCMAVPTALLLPWLARLDNQNTQREFYLTDIVRFAASDGVPVVAHHISDVVQVAGVNSPLQLAELERSLQQRTALALLESGVRLADPARIDVRGHLNCASDVEIDVNCIFEGQVSLGEGVRVGAHCVLANCTIEAGAHILPFTHIDGEALGVRVGCGARIGPFARLRPGTELAAEVHIGNFVEVKNSRLGHGAKANHLAYLGDAVVGERVNFGAGSITANYDGANKHTTVIEADVHVGSNCVLIAPVTIGAGSTVGGGSTITKNTPPGGLSVARGKQMSLPNWRRPVKAPR
jgi:bifunctional UDP-N-acetylglucosamine pyrophosphorylase / glucosamine-1-phosphate N-acetyltransferase